MTRGGAVMNVTEEITGALRAETHGNIPIVFDARGNGGGDISPTITGGHQAHISDYTAIVLEYEVVQQSEKRPVGGI